MDSEMELFEIVPMDSDMELFEPLMVIVLVSFWISPSNE
jgi:hypothetical protein